jgi:hypothetical protein
MGCGQSFYNCEVIKLAATLKKNERGSVNSRIRRFCQGFKWDFVGGDRIMTQT